ncbi:MAG: choice-of-anchor tandem repeat GloVer-containing protein [Rhizomicrobium sp.]
MAIVQVSGVDARNSAAVFALTILASISMAHASSFKVLHAFSGPGDGCYPASGSLIIDARNDLYGTTVGDTCGDGYGTVFEVAPNGAESVLYTFPGRSAGASPEALVMDEKGNLWGTTFDGGDNYGQGLIFEINTHGHESVIHTFSGSPNDGCDAQAAMVADSNGNFYGTAWGCGKYGYGAVYKLAASGKESLLYSFRGGHDGFDPFAGLVVDPFGNFYGTTGYGGRAHINCDDFSGCGTVFELTPNGTKTPLYKFKGPPKDGERLFGNVIIGTNGNMYGTTNGGGRAGCTADEGCGIVFELARGGTEAVLHYFAGERSDGGNPAAGLISDIAGNMYGTTQYGAGAYPCNGADGCGTVFEIAPDGTEAILHKFKESTDGANPPAGLVADGKGHFFGTAYEGGKYGYGTVFEITP